MHVCASYTTKYYIPIVLTDMSLLFIQVFAQQVSNYRQILSLIVGWQENGIFFTGSSHVKNKEQKLKRQQCLIVTIHLIGWIYFLSKQLPQLITRFWQYSQTISMVVLCGILYELRKVNFIAQNSHILRRVLCLLWLATENHDQESN